MNSIDRNQVISLVEVELLKRYDLLKQHLIEVRDALSSEGKNTAGDKHETSRAMNQLEQEKLGKQLMECEKDLDILQRIKIWNNKPTIQSGSLVRTNHGYFFICLGLGILKNEWTELFVISPSAPLSHQLIGKKAGDTFQWNNRSFLIEEIN